MLNNWAEGNICFLLNYRLRIYLNGRNDIVFKFNFKLNTSIIFLLILFTITGFVTEKIYSESSYNLNISIEGEGEVYISPDKNLYLYIYLLIIYIALFFEMHFAREGFRNRKVELYSGTFVY